MSNNILRNRHAVRDTEILVHRGLIYQIKSLLENRGLKLIRTKHGTDRANPTAPEAHSMTDTPRHDSIKQSSNAI